MKLVEKAILVLITVAMAVTMSFLVVIPNGTVKAQDSTFTVNSTGDAIDQSHPAQIAYSGDDIVVTVSLASVSDQLTFDQSHVEDNRLEYRWGVRIDTDGNVSTGDGSGYDVEISLTHFKPPGNSPFTGTILDGTQKNTWVLSSSGAMSAHNIEAAIDHDTKSIIMIAKQSWEEFADFDINDRFCCKTYYYSPSGSVQDITSDNPPGSNIVSDPEGDVSYSFVDITGGKVQLPDTIPPSVTVTDPTISAETDYSVVFNLGTDVAEGEYIIITFPDDTDITDVDATDCTIAATSGIGSNAFIATTATSISKSDAELTITVPDVNTQDKIGIGATVEVIANDVLNPSNPGDYTLTVATSAEPTAVASEVYTIETPVIGPVPGIVELYNPAGILMAWSTGATAIADAIDSAGEDYTIKLGPGHYTENVDVNKGLTIQSQNGTDSPIVQAANPNDNVFTITADNVTIKGLDVYGATDSGRCGIMLLNVSGCTIENNRCGWDDNHRNHVGIYLLDSNDSNSISGNICNSNAYSGIYLHESSNNTISGNTCNSSDYGIYLDSSSSNTLSGNTCNSNDYGFHGISVSPTFVNNCIANNNLYGIYLEDVSTPTFGSSAEEWNDIHGNGIDDLRNGTADITAAYVYWGTANELEIEDRLYHYPDDGNLGTVIYTPWEDFDHPPPIADANGPYIIDEGQGVTYDSSLSYDPSCTGSIDSYDWDLDNDGQYDDAIGASPAVTWAELVALGLNDDGIYTIAVHVTDSGGDTDTDTTTITINNLPPVADANGPYTIDEGQDVSFNGTSSFDPSPTGTIVSYDWDFDDGNTGTGATPSHTYAAAGTYTVTLTVTDDDGATDTATTTAEIEGANMAPVSDPNGPYAGVAGSPVSFDSTGSSDADGTIVSYDWDFDGGNTGTGATPSHTYAAAGTYTVALTVTDDDGAMDTATTTAEIEGANMAPVSDPNGPYAGVAGSPVSFDSTGSSDADGTIVSYDWDFGDGNTGAGATPSHTYAAAGTYTVALTVTDDDGAMDTATTTAEIEAENMAPVSDPNGPYAGVMGSPVSFDGTGSSDADGTIVSYDWDFGDGNTGTGATPSHTYAAAGTYTVALTVTDDDGAMDTATTIMTLTVLTATIDTEAVVGGSGAVVGGSGAVVGGSGSAPYVCAKWETPDHDPMDGTQIEPVPGDQRMVKFYVVVGDPNGIPDVAAVYIKVYHPDGSFKFQLDSKRINAWTVIPYTGMIDMDGDCAGETAVPDALEDLDAQGRITYGFDPVRGVTMTLDMLKYDLEYEKQLLIELMGEMDYCQPSGDYMVEAIAVDTSGKSGTLENYFFYFSIVALRCDFDSINWGSVNVNQWNVLYGDEDMSTPTKPTVQNIGNDPAKIVLHFTKMIGDNFGKEIKDFDAYMLGGHIELEACTPEVIRDGTGAPVNLPPCTPTQIDFSVHPPVGTPQDTYVGEMTITIYHQGP